MKIKLIVFIIILGIIITGCSDNGYEEYEKAVIKTDNLNSGKIKFEGNYLINFNEEEFSVEDYKKAKLYSNYKFKGTSIFDKEAEKNNFYGNIEFAKLGFDLEYFKDKNMEYLKIPFLGKYIDLSNLDEFKEIELKNSNFDFNSKSFEMDPEMINKISELWTEKISDENVFKGKKFLMSTPEGDVKVIKYTVSFSDEILKELIYKTVLLYDESIETGFLDEIVVEEFNYDAYVDIDGYIIEENFNVSYRFDDVLEINYFELDFKLINYDLNEKQEFENINLDESKLLKAKDLENIINNGIKLER